MRIEGIPSIEAAQAFAPRCITLWNARFSVEPRDPADAHRPWTQTPQALDEAIARHEERALSKALTFNAEGTRYCVKATGAGSAMRGARITLRHFLDGALQVRYKDRVLACMAFEKLPRPSPAEDEKTLDARVEAVIVASALNVAQRGCE